MKENLSLIFSILVTVAGGLGLFLMGMKHLSEGLQATAGGGLRKFMTHATSHRLVGVGTGIFSTMLVQSSSIITVMLVGFVSTALMTLFEQKDHPCRHRIRRYRRACQRRVQRRGLGQ